MDAELPEESESLWTLAVPPAIWGVHFLASYCTAAIWCAKFAETDRPLSTVRVAIAVYTVVALVGIGISGRRGWRRHAFSGSTDPHHVDSPAARHRFLGFATLLLSGLSGVAIVFAALVVVFIRSCH